MARNVAVVATIALSPRRPLLRRLLLAAGLAALAVAGAAGAGRAAGDPPLQEVPGLVAAVAKGELPPVGRRLPDHPLVVDLAAEGRQPGKPGGVLHMLIAEGGDARVIQPFGYARLVGYDLDYRIVPDILEKLDVQDERIFTLHLRPGHRWSDGHPFTSEDFRYYWQDVIADRDLTPGGPPPALLVQGRAPQVEILDPLTVRYSWPTPNQAFLPALAGADPLVLYGPAHYLRQFHIRYADPVKLADRVAESKLPNWAELHRQRDTSLWLTNPDMPTLQPWVIVSQSPDKGIELHRNPFYHRIDKQGHQLPYIDAIHLDAVPRKEIPPRTARGESDLQASGLSLDDVALLEDAAGKGGPQLRLWPSGRGSQYALYPNLNSRDKGLAALLRDVRFRRALSLAIDRNAINKAVYEGRALPRANTVLPDSPLFNPDEQIAWSEFDPARANELLTAVGLKLDPQQNVRRLPDGRRLSLLVAMSAIDPMETEILQQIQESWRKVGIELLIGAPTPESFRDRLYNGEAPSSIAPGFSGGLATPAMSPRELVPSSVTQNQWPRWGRWVESDHAEGDPPDLPPAAELLKLYGAWQQAASEADQKAAWRRILQINADQVFTIGLVGEVPQPVAVSPHLRNVPDRDFYNWEPGAYFGIYRPDTFWFDRK
jgi:peptide/nickel transport system substrate-binding protein